MQAPAFWYRAPGALARTLSPLGGIYAAGTARRLRKGARIKPGVPVICVGNINLGGTGKTPTVIALIEVLQARGLKPAVISRGYGGTIAGPHRVDPRRDSADLVGDEPLLLAAFAPVVVGRDRAAAARLAARDSDVLLMDDGFQNGSVAQDLALVVVDAARGFGNGRVLPAGPLREPLKTGLARADMLLSIGDDPAQAGFATPQGLPPGAPHLRGALEPLPTGMDWAGLDVVAFAGIGQPEKFFATLRGLGANLVETLALSDHQPLEPALLRRLLGRAHGLGGRLVTTEKDAVRLPQNLRTEVLTLPVRLRLTDDAPLQTALDAVLPG